MERTKGRKERAPEKQRHEQRKTRRGKRERDEGGASPRAQKPHVVLFSLFARVAELAVLFQAVAFAASVALSADVLAT